MRRGHHSIRTLYRCVAGAAAIEFAIIAMVMILLFVGMLEFGRGLYVYNGIAYAADVGARRILLDNNIAEANLKDAVRDAFRGGNPASLEIESELDGGYRTIEVGYQFNLLIPNQAPIGLLLKRRVPLTNPPT